MPTKDELQERLASCRDRVEAREQTIVSLRARLAKCRAGETPPLPDPDPPPDPEPTPTPGKRQPWQPKTADQAPEKGDFPSLAKGNVGLADAAILTKAGSTSESGRTYENLDIAGSVTPANGTTYRNCRISANGWWAVRASSGVKATFEDCEFVGRPDGDSAMDCNGADFTLNRVYLHGSEDGCKLASGKLNDCLIANNASSLSGPHYDGCQSMSGRGIRIHHCFIQLPQQSGGTSAYIIKSDFGSIDDVLIDYCYLDGHSYTVDPCDGGHGNPTNVRANYNRFGLAVFGAWTQRFSWEHKGNVWDSDGKAISDPGERRG